MLPPLPPSHPAVLYAIALVPDDAAAAFCQQEYGAWFIGHPQAAALAPEPLQALYAAGCTEGAIDPHSAERLAAFADYLETQGYTVWQTAADGYVVLRTTLETLAEGPG